MEARRKINFMKIIKSILIILFLIFTSASSLHAEEADVVVDLPAIPEIEVIDPPIVPEIPTSSETVLIRNGDTVIYTGSIDLPAEGTIEIIDNASVTHSVNSRSVLGLLYALDQSSDDFSLSNLQYYSSFSSFYLKCLTSLTSGELCDSWQYTVGGVSPSTSVDATLLTGGETIGLYFGNPYRVTLSHTSVNTNENITATAQTYNYLDNAWSVRTGVNIGVTKPNPDDPWSPIVVASYPVDANGEVVFQLSSAGLYSVGVSEDYYFPSHDINVSEVSSGGGGQSNIKTFSTTSALSFLSSNQRSDGSFGDILYTDWAAIALASMGNDASSEKQRLINYFKENPMQSSIATDNQRHAMALMSLGINPYTGTDVDYISKITSSFDGVQFGEVSLYNDDIFALITLRNAGFNTDDTLIQKSVSFLITNQSADGSWGSIDLTSAGIQALRAFPDLPNVSTSISKAENYLINSGNSDGGFDNSFATSWALQALSQNPLFQTESSEAEQYLAVQQQSDGGVDAVSDSLENRIWSTAYAIPAVLHLPWSSIMESFSKPTLQSRIADNDTTIAPKEAQVIKDVEEKNEEIVKVEEVTPIQAPKTKIIKVAKVDNTPKKASTVESKSAEYNNPLPASVLGASVVKDTSNEMMRSVIRVILAPFMWLLVYFGF